MSQNPIVRDCTKPPIVSVVINFFQCISSRKEIFLEMKKCVFQISRQILNLIYQVIVFQIPGMAFDFLKTQFDWNYYAESKYACQLAPNKKFYMTLGKMLGGTSSRTECYMFAVLQMSTTNIYFILNKFFTLTDIDQTTKVLLANWSNMEQTSTHKTKWEDQYFISPVAQCRI